MRGCASSFPFRFLRISAPASSERFPQLLSSFRLTSLRRRLRTLTTTQGKIHRLTFVVSSLLISFDKQRALRMQNVECRMFSLQRAFHSAFCVLHSAFSFPFCLSLRCNQALDRLVSSSSTHCCASADDLSPGSPPGVLLLSDGSLLLEVGFTLRCFQRLSHPHFASLLCRWHDNSCTSGASIPVLSY